LAEPAPPPRGLASLESELSALRARRDGLRQTAALPGAELRPALEAALAELDAAIEILAAGGGPAEPVRQDPPPEALNAERQLLRAAFQDAPVPLFLLERDGTVRRANRAAGDLTGAGTGYATGRPFTAFLGLPSRAAVQTQLAAVIRTGQGRLAVCELVTPDGPLPCDLTIGPVRLRGDADQLIVAVTARGPQPPAPASGGSGAAGRKPRGRDATGKAARTAASGEPAPGQRTAVGPIPPRPAPDDAPPPVVASLTRRLDLVTAATRLLLENVTRSESVTLQRCARLLADELAAWVIVDVVRGRRLRRQFVMGPEDQQSAELARVVAATDPLPGSAPTAVAGGGGPWLEAHAEDPGILGTGPDGVPLLMLLGTTSVLSVPISEGDHAYGVLTLARQAGAGHFDMTDLGLVEELGHQLALAIQLDRIVRRQAEIADTLRAGLLPRQLPSLPGLEVAVAHLAATGTSELGGDFYDLAPAGATGWRVTVGDVCGRGEGVAAAGAAARHTIRVIGHGSPEPADVLSRANEILLDEGFDGRFVTAVTAHARWRGAVLRVVLACAGHPGPVLLRRDGRVQQAGGGGQPLGIFPDAEQGREEHDLASGDTLVFYTDGLAGACSQESGYFDDQLPGEIAALAGQPPAQILARLQTRAQAWCGGEIQDDITMLAVRAGDPPGSG
jgi:serine phosphatase RsbU (regulator of sigma subunit)/PAS domain-containing protein